MLQYTMTKGVGGSRGGVRSNLIIRIMHTRYCIALGLQLLYIICSLVPRLSLFSAHTERFVEYNNQTQKSLLLAFKRKEKAWYLKLPAIKTSFARGCWNFCGWIDAAVTVVRT